jgi:hypothetical protein
MAPLWSALLGYAIGTAQILALDWFKARAAHRRYLRLLRAELRRVGSLTSKYDWKGTFPVGPAIRFPQPPSVSPAYVDTVTGTDFLLTDEHDDDNSQEALLLLLDGCGTLQRYSKAIHESIEEVNTTQSDAVRTHAVKSAMALSERYDQDVDRLKAIVADALRDIERRLDIAQFRPQIWRTMRRKLPKGSNPPALGPGDPRSPKN